MFVAPIRKRHRLADGHPENKTGILQGVSYGALSAKPKRLTPAPSHLQKIAEDKSTHKEGELNSMICAHIGAEQAVSPCKF